MIRQEEARQAKAGFAYACKVHCHIVIEGLRGGRGEEALEARSHRIIQLSCHYCPSVEYIMMYWRLKSLDRLQTTLDSVDC